MAGAGPASLQTDPAGLRRPRRSILQRARPSRWPIPHHQPRGCQAVCVRMLELNACVRRDAYSRYVTLSLVCSYIIHSGQHPSPKATLTRWPLQPSACGLTMPMHQSVTNITSVATACHRPPLPPVARRLEQRQQAHPSSPRWRVFPPCPRRRWRDQKKTARTMTGSIKPFGSSGGRRWRGE